MKILELNPHHPSLRLDPLEEKLEDLYSVSINISYRITIEFLISGKEIILVNVGHHDEAYQQKNSKKFSGPLPGICLKPETGNQAKQQNNIATENRLQSCRSMSIFNHGKR
jgi:hypothetical protein